jgi:PAS domain S-box-containing protein
MPVFEWSHQQQPHGRLIPTEVRLLRLPAKGQNLIRASIIDNTERKEAERALRESEAKYRALFEGSSQGVVLQDEHQFLEVNPAAVRIMGRQHANELVGKHPHELAPPKQPNGESSEAASRRHVEECMSRGSARFEWLARTAAGQDIPLEVTLTRIEWSGRQIIQGFITDISERKRAQAALEESEARFSSAFEASPLIITITRLSDARFVLVNDAFVKWSGYSREEILGRDGVELRMWVQPQDRQDFWNDLLTTGSVRERECFLRDRSGKRFTMLASSELIHLNHEPHMLGMALDITQRKQAEVELLKTLERERELSQLKSNFVSMVSHEFRTPLGIIQSSAELLREFYQRMDTAEREEQLNSIGRNTRRMASMMEGILVLSRVDAGKLDFKPDRFDFTDFCRRVVEEVLSATHRRCSIELSLDSIPAQAQADERLLTHIFTNLLTNAVKYSEPGATVSFLVQRDGRDALCLVRDSGIGIPEDDQLQLFTGFHRGANVGTRPGTGLGLLMVKRCTELHGGTVLLRSRVGEGTTVTVRLPLFCAP